MENINLDAWSVIIKEPTWYLTLVPEFKKIADAYSREDLANREIKDKIYDFFEAHLLDDTIALGSSGRDWDVQRKPIDTMVIHHTSIEPGLRPSRLSAIELVRLYAPYYFRPYLEEDKEIQGTPIWSNHMRDGRQVFWPYHWMIRQDGTAERLLEDNEIGWHAGKWDINCRSVAICFDGDFEDGTPSETMLKAAAELIKKHYSGAEILGHSEINDKTTCPSRLFLNGWKKNLLGYLTN